jgi:MFS family permease
VVSLGRLGDMYGRGLSGTAAALWLVIMRVFQGVGVALLLANPAAILTDAFPEDQRGMAIGISQVAG